MSARQKVGIIGSGLIGRSWSMLFAAADYDVMMYDIDEVQLTNAMEEVKKGLGNLERLGLLRGDLSASQQYANISNTSVFEECVKNAFYIQECVPERIAVKIAIYEKAERLMDDACILASSTSTFLPSRLSQSLKHRGRFIVTHPTNPPFYAPLVELVPSHWADKDLIENTKAIMKKLGQVPVVLKKEIDGFVLNTLQCAILKESWRLIKDGVISVEGLDKVMSAGLGRRYAFMGPIETAYLNADGMYSYADRYAERIDGVMSTFREPDKFSGPVLDQIQTEMEELVPMDKLQERRQWRDKRLASLAQLQRQLDEQDK